MPDATIPPYEPFLLDDRSRQSPVELGCDVTYKNALLRYEISFDSTTIRQEVLTLLDGNSEDKLIDRQMTGGIGGRLIEDSKANRLYVEGMQPNVSVLAKLAQHGPQQGKDSVQPYYRAIRSATHFEDYSASTLETSVLGPIKARLADDSRYRNWVMDHLMRVADFGICDVDVRRKNLTFKEIRERLVDNPGFYPDSPIILSFIHEGELNQPLDFSRESSGTKKILDLRTTGGRCARIGNAVRG